MGSKIIISRLPRLLAPRSISLFSIEKVFFESPFDSERFVGPYFGFVTVNPDFLPVLLVQYIICERSSNDSEVRRFPKPRSRDAARKRIETFTIEIG